MNIFKFLLIYIFVFSLVLSLLRTDIFSKDIIQNENKKNTADLQDRTITITQVKRNGYKSPSIFDILTKFVIPDKKPIWEDFLLITVNVKNTSQSIINFQVDQDTFLIETHEGDTRGPRLLARLNKPLTSGVIKPNQTKAGDLVFTIGKSDKKAKLIYLYINPKGIQQKAVFDLHS
ncbi:MAG TPA: DUF4352 domain-containing protein [Candidatus Nitrosocosmicus sp.]|nr:DUF4352 domain-containing protein [Candidatus Nitrosocosmicus sp.]